MPKGEYIEGRKEYMRKYRRDNRERLSAQNLLWREDNKETVRMHAITHRYGITRAEYKSLMLISACEICGGCPAQGERLALDHDHATGKVRGMICLTCNSALGFVQESESILLKMINYLKERKGHA